MERSFTSIFFIMRNRHCLKPFTKHNDAYREIFGNLFRFIWLDDIVLENKIYKEFGFFAFTAINKYEKRQICTLVKFKTWGFLDDWSFWEGLL